KSDGARPCDGHESGAWCPKSARPGHVYFRSYRREALHKPRIFSRTSLHFGALALLVVSVSGAQAQFQRMPDFQVSSPSGSFLAARTARAERDVSSASTYY